MSKAYLYRGAVDDAGRGSCVGPGVVACVIFPFPDLPELSRFWPIPEVQDHKLLGGRNKRQKRAAALQRGLTWLKSQPHFIGMGIAGLDDIERRGLKKAMASASERAVRRAVEALTAAETLGGERVYPEMLLLDGEPPLRRGRRTRGGISGYPRPQLRIKDGDRQYFPLALAGLFARQRRDEEMARIATRYPGYDLRFNDGAGTKPHLKAIAKYGLTPCHRTGSTIRTLRRAGYPTHEVNMT